MLKLTLLELRFQQTGRISYYVVSKSIHSSFKRYVRMGGITFKTMSSGIKLDESDRILSYFFEFA